MKEVEPEMFFGNISLWIRLYPAMTAFIDQYSLPNNFFDIGQL
jgi:hypothetical protein